MWYDILVYVWFQINIKITIITTTTTSRNTGNLVMCLCMLIQNEILDIHKYKSDENGMMSQILFNKIKNKEYNNDIKKDYYSII